MYRRLTRSRTWMEHASLAYIGLGIIYVITLPILV